MITLTYKVVLVPYFLNITYKAFSLVYAIFECLLDNHIYQFTFRESQIFRKPQLCSAFVILRLVLSVSASSRRQQQS